MGSMVQAVSEKEKHKVFCRLANIPCQRLRILVHSTTMNIEYLLLADKPL
jgi:hypothetical protein